MKPPEVPRPAPVRFQVTSLPPGARVSLSGRDLGPTPVSFEGARRGADGRAMAELDLHPRRLPARDPHRGGPRARWCRSKAASRRSVPRVSPSGRRSRPCRRGTRRTRTSVPVSRTLSARAVASGGARRGAAPSGLRADARVEARRHFKAGMAMINGGDLEAGVSELLEAYAIKPAPLGALQHRPGVPERRQGARGARVTTGATSDRAAGCRPGAGHGRAARVPPGPRPGEPERPGAADGRGADHLGGRGDPAQAGGAHRAHGAGGGARREGRRSAPRRRRPALPEPAASAAEEPTTGCPTRRRW